MVKYLEETEWSTLPHHKTISDIIRSGSTINWAFKASGKWSLIHGGGCCGSMGSSWGIDDPTLESVVLSLRVKNGDPARYKWWWENILDPSTSPWHEVLPEGGATIYKSGVAWAYEIPVTYKMSFSNTINMFIACRQNMVEPHSITYIEELYHKLKKVDDNVTFSEALACGIMTYQNYMMAAPQRFTTGNGWLGAAGFFSPRHIAQRVMSRGKTKTFASRNYYPSCATWRHHGAHDEYLAFLAATEKKAENAVSIFKFNAYGNPLANDALKYYTVDPLEMLKFLREEIKKGGSKGKDAA